MFLHSLMCIWCLTFVIDEMTATNEITAKIDHILFTCNCFIGLRKRAHTCKYLQKSRCKNFSKFQQIPATAMEAIFRKRSFLQLVNVLWKRTLRQLYFYMANFISLKRYNFLVHTNRISHNLSIHWSGAIFLWLMTWWFANV